MATQKGRGGDSSTEILKDILIVQLGAVGVPQQTIREIIGCDINRVSRIVKHLKQKNKKEEAKR
jgi:hypothetical protein